MPKTVPLRQLDRTFAAWRALPGSRLTLGWLRAIREALGMTTRQLARAVGVSQASVVSIERAEAKGDVTLATLRRYAAAVDCELTYALVPKRSLREAIEERADKLAREQVSSVDHSMAPEGQSTSAQDRKREIADLRRKLLEGKRSRLWR